MKSLANTLAYKSFPKISAKDEDDLSCLKQRDIMVDGYNVIIYFNVCKYERFSLETLQIFGQRQSFLPFFLVCKIAHKFLGDKELSFVELIHNKDDIELFVDHHSRKVYVWTIYYDKKGKLISNPFSKKGIKCSYSGLNYSYINRECVTFF